MQNNERSKIESYVNRFVGSGFTEHLFVNRAGHLQCAWCGGILDEDGHMQDDCPIAQVERALAGASQETCGVCPPFGPNVYLGRNGRAAVPTSEIDAPDDAGAQPQEQGV